jgi:hypothetical protein
MMRPSRAVKFVPETPEILASIAEMSDELYNGGKINMMDGARENPPDWGIVSKILDCSTPKIGPFQLRQLSQNNAHFVFAIVEY